MIKKDDWYFNRLSRMSLPEIFCRVKNLIYIFYEKSEKIKKKFEYNFSGTGNFILSPKDIILIRKYYDQNTKNKENLFNNAENILQHKFSFFMLDNFYFGEQINWHKDYPNNKICEYSFYADINYKDCEKNGDVKYIWEQNRFLHFYKLSQALLVTSQAKYAKGIVSQLESWINNNAYLMGINWANSLEIAIRLISWSWAYQSLKLINYKIDIDFEKRFISSVYQQLDYISNHLSQYSSANNQLIGEAAGLVIAGCTFNFGKDSKKWVKKGLKILENEIQKQISLEGLSKEQAFSYHMFIFDFFLISYLFGTKNGYNFSDRFKQNLNKMAKVLLDISDNEFTLPNIGDAEEGMVVKFANQTDFNPLLSLLNISSIFFDDENFKFKSGLDEKALWLSGYEGLTKFSKLAKQNKPQKSVYLKDSGYCLFKNENTYGLLDVGKLGYLSIAAHGHADALSFLLNYKGKKILIDTGTFTYNPKSVWRKYFKGTSAHNTLCVDKKSQSVYGESFLWLKKANVRVDNVKNSQDFDYIKASHDGYTQQKIGLKHTREVCFKKGEYFVILDRAENIDQKSHTLDLNWHFSNECDVNHFENGFVAVNNDVNVYLSIISNTKPQTIIYKGSENVKAGWVSNKYDFRQITATLNSSIKINKNEIFITLITLDEPHYNLKFEENRLSFDYKGSYQIMDVDNLV